MGNTITGLVVFLLGRKQRVRLNDSYSYTTSVESGVPQGSVLGPLLFVIYINDMVKSMKFSHLQTFADDTKISRAIYSESDRHLLQQDLDMIKSWSAANNMQLNRNKFEYICHQSKVNPLLSLLDELPFMNEQFMYSASGEVLIYPSMTVKDLGVIVSKELDWDDHICKITLQAKRICGWILNVFATRDKTTMMLLFKSLVRSRLEYCCELWDPFSIKHISAIEQVQKKFTNKIAIVKDLNYWQRLESLNISSLQRRRERQTIVHTWKIANNKVRNDVGLQFKVCERTSKLKALIKPMPKIRGKFLSSYENSYTIRSAKLWNKLPHQVVETTTLPLFIAKLDEWLASIPDKPPVKGYYHENRNSILDYSFRNFNSF